MNYISNSISQKSNNDGWKYAYVHDVITKKATRIKSNKKCKPKNSGCLDLKLSKFTKLYILEYEKCF